MNNVYYDYDDSEDLNEKLNAPCECGHKLSYHGFTEQKSISSDSHYLRVSQCLFCECKEYHKYWRQ